MHPGRDGGPTLEEFKTETRPPKDSSSKSTKIFRIFWKPSGFPELPVTTRIIIFQKKKNANCLRPAGRHCRKEDSHSFNSTKNGIGCALRVGDFWPQQFGPGFFWVEIRPSLWEMVGWAPITLDLCTAEPMEKIMPGDSIHSLFIPYSEVTNNLWRGHLTIRKKGTKNCQVYSS